MKIYRPAPETGSATIREYGALADRGGDPLEVARAWTKAGFDDQGTASWLEARCYDPASARALADLDVLPGQAAKRTRDGKGDYVDTVGYKVANGDLTARQGAARCMSSR